MKKNTISEIQEAFEEAGFHKEKPVVIKYLPGHNPGSAKGQGRKAKLRFIDNNVPKKSGMGVSSVLLDNNIIISLQKEAHHG